MKKLIAALGVATALTLAPQIAAAQDFPAQPITIVVPFAAGGPTDTVTRLVAQAMSQDLGQQVVVENVGGAGGTLGAARVAQAEANGYTLLLHHIGMATTATLYRELPYNAIEDFEHVGLVTEVPMVMVGRPDLEANSMEEVVAYVRENGEDVMYANAGIGAASHLCGLLFMDAVDTQMTTIPYQGTGPALTDLMGGQVDLMCDQTTNTTNQIRDGSIKGFAVTVPERLDALPDIATAAESGLDGFEVTIWHGVYAPKGTPEDVVARLSQSLQVALQDETVIERFADLGTAPSSQEDATPEALKAKLEAEINLWRPIIEAAGVYAN
ncbi:tripartite tricarboxylate transporter substrate binding protein BugD [Mesorhizobium microcysteis]|jgi:tripartite-type tricarboxylate transporter receptor subunit TctC|uniref:Tripartite tricarboxylate transporter substrate binding protein BugD n=1 Tax=Neoaquamicrobium microcysteis TaxID=2682781 RepID=A0A5D4H3P0_9HYPH|nr:tripartite tricarboxylate transporter substrate-binding protein [Mesorhizobium microcysteis]TYR34912.1 tripartite tricarboxylate transporter substrate binding protein BugD [Mesorhizobium microcysteis]